jgi:hypothetical protein
MDDDRIPRAWIGEEEGIYWPGRKEPGEFKLLDVVPEGLVLEVATTNEFEGKTYRGAAHILTPWHAITSVQRYVGMEEIVAQTEDAE